MCEESAGKIHSGCTAVTAFLRIEDPRGSQTFRSPHSRSGLPSSNSPIPNSATSSTFTNSTVVPDSPLSTSNNQSPTEETHGSQHDSSGAESPVDSSLHPELAKSKKDKKTLSGSRLKKALKSLSGGASSMTGSNSPRSASPSSSRHSKSGSITGGPHSGHSRQASAASTGIVNTGPMTSPPPSARRVLYTANVGDARGVLCRGGRAARLTYDHKGSDKQEAKRITDAGGFVMSGRVNGVLAVTRSLGDSSMKEFVVGAPYTTETELCEEDEFLVLACDGLWDVTTDQQAVDIVREIDDAQHASQKLLKHALSHHTTDNVTVVVVRFRSIVPKTA
ncbi:hypothetical protein HGRIS_002022 [Hohenbuehelia grisea]|uniref:PPM-type phosphatase domain-containing protein n=1 Tax=Hohenbuehelia grisea TaxID=104357 RepID=A0ABR3JJ68_9AGAR